MQMQQAVDSVVQRLQFFFRECDETAMAKNFLLSEKGDSRLLHPNKFHTEDNIKNKFVKRINLNTELLTQVDLFSDNTL